MTKDIAYDKNTNLIQHERNIYNITSITLLIISLSLLVAGLYYQLVSHSLAPLIVGIVAGATLAIPLELWNFSDPDTLQRVMAFQDRFLMVCFGFAIGLGAILLYGLNLIPGVQPHFGFKALFVPGIVIGGLLFGIGVGFAGYFPGTIWIALGQGRRDAIYAVAGGLLGALSWSLIFGAVRNDLWNTLNFGPITWYSIAGLTSKLEIFLVSLVFGGIMFLLFMFLPRYPKLSIKQSCAYHLTGKNKQAYVFDEQYSEELSKYPNARRFIVRLTNESSETNARSIILLGLAFTVTAVAVIYLRQIFGESTTYAWIWSQLLYGLNPSYAASNPYWQIFGGLKISNGIAIDNPFSQIGWEPFSDLGTFLGGLISSLFISKRFMGFKKQVPNVWQKRFGKSEKLRFIGSFFGAFLVLFGARMANGCASGHILSGNIQMAVSSFVFMIAVLAGAWLILGIVMRLKINGTGFR
ncbi:MAG: YeeE/YedE thiosulfate transporter family protein [Conexivisphaerales archaeon]